VVGVRVDDDGGLRALRLEPRGIVAARSGRRVVVLAAQEEDMGALVRRSDTYQSLQYG
jgi:hypothetical protein